MRYNKNVLFGGLLALSFAASPLQAAVSSSEAARLGQDLTPFGSPKAGNDAGTIPAWDGGLTEPPAGYWLLSKKRIVHNFFAPKK